MLTVLIVNITASHYKLATLATNSYQSNVSPEEMLHIETLSEVN